MGRIGHILFYPFLAFPHTGIERLPTRLFCPILPFCDNISGVMKGNTALTKRWHIAPPIPSDIARNYNSSLHPVVEQLLYNRGLYDSGQIHAFLQKQYAYSTDPFLLADMDRGVERIGRAIEREEMIVIYGDFDADGVTSTVLLTEALRGLGVPRERVRPYIPDRIDEGYGLNKEALTTIRQKFSADLVISVDCGIRSNEEVIHGNDLGLEMIITDHHSLGSELPPAYAVINPKRPDSTYPETMLAGVGIAYKIAQALYQTFPHRVSADLTHLLDLVAIGTVADIAPLLGENRLLTVQGLRELNTLRRPGVAMLAKLAKLNTPFNAETIGFGIGPRLNAAGRLAHAYDAARLLAAFDEQSAMGFAQRLEELNNRRKKLTEEQGKLAESLIDPTASLLLAAHETFEAGIVGLAASRLTEKYYRPTIIIERGSEQSRGSCRSIAEFHITKALDQVAHLLVRHGGHAAAAGFTLDNANLPAFHEAMLAIATEQLADHPLQPQLEIDMELPFHLIDYALIEQLQQLEPTGEGNPTPLFMSRHLQLINHRVMGADGTHLQLEVASEGKGFRAVGFGLGEWADHLPARVDLAYNLSINEWQGKRSIQLMVKDIRPSDDDYV